MDSGGIEKQGLGTLQPYFRQIDSVTDLPSLTHAMTELEKIGVNNQMAWYIGQDDKNSDAIALKFWQGGIGLPEREFYFKKDSTSQKIRTAFVTYIRTLLTLSGVD